MPSQPSIQEQRYVILYVRNIITTPAYWEALGTMQTWKDRRKHLPYKFQHWSFNAVNIISQKLIKLGYESENYRSWNAFQYELSPQNWLGCCSSWFKSAASEICSFRNENEIFRQWWWSWTVAVMWESVGQSLCKLTVQSLFMRRASISTIISLGTAIFLRW